METEVIVVEADWLKQAQTGKVFYRTQRKADTKQKKKNNGESRNVQIRSHSREGKCFLHTQP